MKIKIHDLTVGEMVRLAKYTNLWLFDPEKECERSEILAPPPINGNSIKFDHAYIYLGKFVNRYVGESHWFWGPTGLYWTFDHAQPVVRV